MFDNLEPTPAEVLFTWRKRRGLNQAEMAAENGVSRVRWCRWETDKEEPAVKLPKNFTLTDQEKCVLLRRRSGLSQEEIGLKVGASRFWVNQMETAKGVSPEKLVEYWKKVG